MLPEIDTSEEEIDVTDYFAQVKDAISSQKQWEVIPNKITVDTFSFNKFFMYKDLDPERWSDRIPGLPTVKTLLSQESFERKENLVPDDAFLDDIFKVDDSYHVMDIDSSQTLATYDAMHNERLVIQGPPGTGKSQTIVNIIAQALGQGKKVIFVSEKMAALEVVKRRLLYLNF